MSTPNLLATEAECSDGRTAPRVSLADIENSIAQVSYVTGDKLTGLEALAILTVCVVVMVNGFSIIGKAAPASPDNFDPELGKRLAYEDAVRQIWPLMGFNLRERLHQGEL